MNIKEEIAKELYKLFNRGTQLRWEKETTQTKSYYCHLAEDNFLPIIEEQRRLEGKRIAGVLKHFCFNYRGQQYTEIGLLGLLYDDPEIVSGGKSWTLKRRINL